MFAFEAGSYGPAFAELLNPPRRLELGPGKPGGVAGEKLRQATTEMLFAARPVRDADMARCCLAALWLYHDHLDEAHQISQSIETATGSYWHALVHRRQPDFDNSKYWSRRVGRHPVYEPLQRAARELAKRQERQPATAFLIKQATWDPCAFVDCCEAYLGSGSPAEILCRQIQLREWQLLFDYCYREAT